MLGPLRRCQIFLPNTQSGLTLKTILFESLGQRWIRTKIFYHLNLVWTASILRFVTSRKKLSVQHLTRFMWKSFGSARYLVCLVKRSEIFHLAQFPFFMVILIIRYYSTVKTYIFTIVLLILWKEIAAKRKGRGFIQIYYEVCVLGGRAGEEMLLHHSGFHLMLFVKTNMFLRFKCF